MKKVTLILVALLVLILGMSCSSPISSSTTKPIPYFEILQFPSEAYVGDYITVVAKSNYHIIREDPAFGQNLTGYYCLEAEQTRSNDTTMVVIPDSLSRTDSENTIKWYVRIIPDAEAGTAIVGFSNVSEYNGKGSYGRGGAFTTRSLILKRK